MTSRVFLPELFYRDGRFHADVRVAAGPPASDPEIVRLPGRAMLPGLVNTHSHAFQRLIRGAAETPGDFWSWRDAMYRAAFTLTPDSVYQVARMAFLEMALSGITTVGEFHYIHRDPHGRPYSDPNLLSLATIRAAREVGLRICLLRVAYLRAGFQIPPDPLQNRFIEPTPEYLQNTEALARRLDGRFAWAGVAPHSIRAVPLADLRRIANWAATAGVPIHMHASEQPAELEQCRAEYGMTPIALLAREGILNARFTAVHGIHVSPEEIEQLARAQAAVCACPTTERNLGDGIVPAVRLHHAGVPIALGSDSQARIDLLEDARELESHLRLQQLRRGLLHPAALLDCASAAGARALRGPPDAADYFTVDLNHPSIAGVTPEHLLSAIVFGLNPAAVRDVIVDGQFIVRDGFHPLYEQILRDYLRVPR